MRTVLPVDSMGNALLVASMVSVLLVASMVIALPGGSLMAKIDLLVATTTKGAKIVPLAVTTTKEVKIAPLVALKMETEAIVALMTAGPGDTMANVDLTEKVGGVDAEWVAVDAVAGAPVVPGENMTATAAMRGRA